MTEKGREERKWAKMEGEVGCSGKGGKTERTGRRWRERTGIGGSDGGNRVSMEHNCSAEIGGISGQIGIASCGTSSGDTRVVCALW